MTRSGVRSSLAPPTFKAPLRRGFLFQALAKSSAHTQIAVVKAWMRGLLLAVRLIRNLQTNRPRGSFAKRIGRLRIRSDRVGRSAKMRTVLAHRAEVLEPASEPLSDCAKVEDQFDRLHTGAALISLTLPAALSVHTDFLPCRTNCLEVNCQEDS